MNNLTIKNFTDVAYQEFYTTVLKPFYKTLTDAEKAAYLMLVENEKFKKIYKDSFQIRTLYDAQCKKLESEQLVVA